MTTGTVSPESFTAICREAATSYTTRRNGYHSSPNQVAYFTFATERKRFSTDHDDAWTALERTTVVAQAGQVATQLDGISGVMVTALKQEQHDAWVALLKELGVFRNQLMRRYGFQVDQATQDVAIADTLSKLLALIRSMVDGPTLDKSTTIIAYARQQLAQSGAIYHFGSPFFNYVFHMLRNEFHRFVQMAQRDHQRSVQIAEAYHLPFQFEELLDATNTTDENAQRQQLKELLRQLLSTITTLPRKRHQVAIYTLAARPQFWLALQVTGLPAPTGYPTAETYRTDRQIADRLKMTDNSVRVNRRHAYNSITETDPLQGELFLILVDVHF